MKTRAILACFMIAGCSPKEEYPDEIKGQMALSDFSHMEQDGDYVHLVFASKKDGKPEAWFDWQRNPEWKEIGSRIDRNHDGQIDVWTYITHTNGDLFAEYDNDFDGRPDKWAYQGGLIKTDTDGDGEPDSERRLGTQPTGGVYGLSEAAKPSTHP